MHSSSSGLSMYVCNRCQVYTIWICSTSQNLTLLVKCSLSRRQGEGSVQLNSMLFVEMISYGKTCWTFWITMICNKKNYRKRRSALYIATNSFFEKTVLEVDLPVLHNVEVVNLFEWECDLSTISWNAFHRKSQQTPAMRVNMTLSSGQSGERRSNTRTFRWCTLYEHVLTM